MAVALALVGGGAMAASPQDATFVNQAAIGGMAEVQAGKLAEARGESAPVKQFGAMMVAEHTPNNEMLTKLAASKSLTPPAQPDAQHQAELKQLQAAPQGSFDKAYITAQVAGHQQMAAVMQQQIASGTDPELKAFAQKTLPVVQMHLQHAQQLASAAK